MRRPAPLAALVALAAVPAAALAQSTAPASTAADIQAAAAAARDGDCPAALAASGRVTGAASFGMLPDAVRASVLELAATCNASLGRLDAAYRDALASAALPGSTDAVWRMRLGLELQERRNEAAVATVLAIAQLRRPLLNATDPRWLLHLDRALETAKATPLRMQLLQVLTGDAYAPDEIVGPDAFCQRLAELLMETGDRAGAAAVVARVSDPSLLIDLSLDPRYRAAFPGDLDVRASAEAALIPARAAMARRPDAIGPVVRVSGLLRMLGRPGEALAALETIRAKVEGKAALPDRDRYGQWWWDELAFSYGMLGNAPRMLAALKRGMAEAEDGGVNVSQRINLAAIQLSLGQATDALAGVAALVPGAANLSPFGAMQAIVIRGCAAKRLGQAALVADALAYVRDHAADAPAALTDLLVCLGDDAGAAAALVARLNDPDQRPEALRMLSTFDPPLPGELTDPDQARLRALAERPDVRAAIAAAGGTRRFNVHDVRL